MYTDMAIFSGRAHPELARSVCANLEMPLGNCDIFEFRDGQVLQVTTYAVEVDTPGT